MKGNASLHRDNITVPKKAVNVLSSRIENERWRQKAGSEHKT